MHPTPHPTHHHPAQSLGGNALTAVLCAVSPAATARDETLSTLKFGAACKTIRNHAVVNHLVNDKTLLKQYRQRIAELQAQIGSYAAAAASSSSSAAATTQQPSGAPASEAAADAAAAAELQAANAEIQQSRDRAAQLERTVARLQVRRWTMGAACMTPV